MVMFGMLLGLGMLIDGAIVITEYADRKMAEGVHRQEAYKLAAQRMFWPVTALHGHHPRSLPTPHLLARRIGHHDVSAGDRLLRAPRLSRLCRFDRP